MIVKTRITLLIAGAGFLASIVFSVAVYFELIEQPFNLLDTVLRDEADWTVEMILRSQNGSQATITDTAAYPLYTYWIEVYELGSNRMLYRSPLAGSVVLPRVNPGSSAIVKAAIQSGRALPGQENHRKVSFRVRTFRIDLQGRSFRVQIARPLEKLNAEIRELIIGIGSALVLSTLMLIVVSYFVAGRILRPIGAMKDLARDISEKNLDRRIPTGQGRDEFSELARTINRMLDRLQYSFARQRDFLYDTSHELKTPLTTMRLAIDEICTDEGRHLPSFAEENLQRVNSQVLRMERLVKDLLNLSSLEMLTGIDPKPVDITWLLSSLVAEYEFLSDARRIAIGTRLPDRLVIQGDGEKLNRAFSNILDNAIKYNVDGGRIDVIGDQTDIKLTVTVTNTGPGVAEAEIPRVFDQFYRVEKSRSTQHGGSGLGLAIVKRIIELHAGKVTFESRPGRWTRVTVCLPSCRRRFDPRSNCGNTVPALGQGADECHQQGGYIGHGLDGEHHHP
jgi:two-component system OmpR family sensor kinase